MEKFPLPARRILPVLLVLSATSLPPVAWADEGRIPIYAPTMISQPGHYVLTRDFCFGSSATPPCVVAVTGITINSNDVTLDFNGHTLSTSEGQVMIRINAQTATRGLTLRNGSLVGGGAGIGSGNTGILSGSDNPVSLVIEDMEFHDMGGDAIDVNSAKSVRVLRCLIQNANRGIQVLGATGAFQARVADNHLSGLVYDGFWLEGMEGGQVLGNVVEDFGSGGANAAGIYIRSSTASGDVGGNLVQGNAISAGGRSTDDDGIVVAANGSIRSPHNLIVDNVVRGNGRYGIWIATDENRIERNLASGNGSDGIRIGLSSLGARNDLEGNQAQGNSGCGIGFTNFSSHIYRNNVMRNNTGGDVCGFGAPSTNAGGNICTAACP